MKHKLLTITAALAAISITAYFLIRPGSPVQPELTSAIKTGTIKQGGRTRTFLYYTPRDLPRSSPLVIALHKAKSSGTEMREMLKYRFDQLADKRGFTVVYPDGYENNWNDCRKAPSDSAHKLSINDVGFISSIIDYFVKTSSIDKSRVFVAGMSNGAHMCFRLAAEIPAKIKAMAITAAQLPVKENNKCRPLEAQLPVLLVNGTDDPISPYEGGEVAVLGNLLKQGNVISAEETARRFVRLHKIRDKALVTRFPGKSSGKEIWIEKKVWKAENISLVVHYIIHGGGHTIPGARPLPSCVFGKTAAEFIMVDRIIDFFMKDI